MTAIVDIDAAKASPIDVEIYLCYPNPRAREIDKAAVEALAAWGC